MAAASVRFRGAHWSSSWPRAQSPSEKLDDQAAWLHASVCSRGSQLSSGMAARFGPLPWSSAVKPHGCALLSPRSSTVMRHDCALRYASEELNCQAAWLRASVHLLGCLLYTSPSPRE
eukprot:12587471-Heterocapsa_arctica.AAC.1